MCKKSLKGFLSFTHLPTKDNELLTGQIVKYEQYVCSQPCGCEGLIVFYNYYFPLTIKVIFESLILNIHIISSFVKIFITK